MFELLVVFLIFVMFAIRTSWFQTWLAQKASAYYSNEFGTEVDIKKVDIRFFSEVDLLGVYVEDIQKDTFIYANTIHADIADWSLSESFVDVSSVVMEDGHVHIRTYQGDSTMNFQHIVDYFASEEEDTTSSDFAVNVRKIQLKDIHFIFQDQNAEPPENGMDFANIELRHFNGGFSDFELKGEEISIALNSLSFVDRSGLALNKFSAKLQIQPDKIGLYDLKIGINKTYLQGDYLSFEISDPEDWGDFVNKVRINSHLKNSVLYLSDLAYFVPDLWGIEGDLRINNLETKGAVYGMDLKNVDLQLLDTTRIMGDFNIPDMSDMPSAFFEENLTLFRTSIADIEQMHLEHILDKRGKKALKEALVQYAPANVIELKNGSMIGGINDFVVDGNVYTGIGNIDLNYGLKFKWNEQEQLYYYSGAQNETWGLIKVENLNMGVIAGNKILDRISGSVQIKGKGFDEQSLDLSFNGALDKIGIYGYDYNGVNIRKGSFSNNNFEGVITVDDDNLALVYIGKVRTKAPMHFDFTVDIDTAHITHLTNKNQLGFYQNLASKIHVDIHGTDVNQFYGDITLNDFAYSDTLVDLKMDKLTLHVSRSPKTDSVVIDSILLRSPYLDMDLIGKYDLNDPVHALKEQFAYVMSHIFESERTMLADEHYELRLKLKDVDDLMKLFGEGIHIAGDTEIRSEFYQNDKTFVLDLNSSQIQYAGFTFNDVKIENHFDSTKAILTYGIDEIFVSDSIAVRDFTIDSKIKDNKFITVMGWDGLYKTEPALFAFETEFKENEDILTVFRPSFFFLKGHQYDLNKNSTVLYNKETIGFHDFKISHGSNYVGLEGLLSKNPDDWLTLTVKDFDLTDLSGLGLVVGLDLSGILNVNGRLADVFNAPKFEATSTVSDLTLNSYMVGDLNLTSKWNESAKSISAEGELLRDNKRTFSFDGDYYLDRKSDNLDFEARFANTDIGFLSAFEDPELYKDIEGILDGTLKIKGEPDKPIVTGRMEIVSSKVKVPMFNVSFGASGIIKFEDGGIIADHLRIHDEEYNMADCQMQIYHYDWSDFNYNIFLDIDNPAMSNKFLAMNTVYKEGEYYYGKAYVSGMVSIFGYDDFTEIEVDVRTEKGTDLTLPMYGTSELEEGSFIIFDSTFFLPDSLKNQEISDEANKVKRLGMNLSMNFEVTKDATVKIIFDPVLEDQIVSKGEGNIEINMDDFGDMTMYGEYVIRNGRYEMRIKQVVAEDFELENGSTIQWSGSPYDAQINISANFTRNTSLGDIMPPELAEGRKKEKVLGILNMTNTLMSPELAFDIVAPNTDDPGRKALNLLKSDLDELNKQFFALLVLRRFIPTSGGAGSGAWMGVAEAQINQVLSGFSESNNIKANLNKNVSTIGFETSVNERTTITSSFGVVTEEEQGGGGHLIGGLNIEYRINEDGTFTMNFFSEPTTSSIRVEETYTQGISLHYQETFNTTRQFRMWQKFLNMFRKKENRVKFEPKEKRSSKYVPVPKDSTSTN